MGHDIAPLMMKGGAWPRGFSWPIAVDLADDSPPPMCNTHSSIAQVTVRMILAVVSNGLLEKWPKHGGGMNHGFKWPLFSPWSSPGLEIRTYQIVSLRGSI